MYVCEGYESFQLVTGAASERQVNCQVGILGRAQRLERLTWQPSKISLAVFRENDDSTCCRVLEEMTFLQDKFCTLHVYMRC